jgi:S-adenosylmethionine:tRNA ribosyltransferase-isomerase
MISAQASAADFRASGLTREGAVPQVVRGPGLAFRLPASQEASGPPELRGLARDEVRLLVSHRASPSLTHARFRELPRFLRAGDVLVINTSGTMPAALDVTRPGGQTLVLHLSSRLPSGQWTVELRRFKEGKSEPFYEAQAGEVIELRGGATAELVEPYPPSAIGNGRRARLWLAKLELPLPLQAYLGRYGRPIRYNYVAQDLPLDCYQTVYATEMGSAEMPSAGRPFTPELITRLVAQGVLVVPLLLHTGVASLEAHEPAYEEYYRLPLATARTVNGAVTDGRRVVAVGTTVVRALESAAGPEGLVQAGEAWTNLIITPERGVRVVDGLLTGLHEPQASHLLMLQALASVEYLAPAYEAALRQGYLWHEFGDSHLILP